MSSSSDAKITLADVLTLIGAILYGFYTFVSFNFSFFGETTKSIFFAVLISLLLGGTALGAKIMKKVDTNFKSALMWEWSLLGLFVLVAMVALLPFSHYFVVSANKSEIQQMVKQNIRDAQKVYDDYDAYCETRFNVYQNTLNSVFDAQSINPTEFAAYGFNASRSKATQIENKMFMLRSKLKPSNYDSLKLLNTKWYGEAMQTIESWKPLGLISVIKKVEENHKNWGGELRILSTYKQPNETAEPFEPSSDIIAVKEYFTSSSPPNGSTIFYALLIYSLMIFSYLITKRHTRFPGFNMVFGTYQKRGNEL